MIHYCFTKELLEKYDFFFAKMNCFNSLQLIRIPFFKVEIYLWLRKNKMYAEYFQLIRRRGVTLRQLITFL